MAQRTKTKERGDCVEVFKDPDQIVVVTTGVHLESFLFSCYSGVVAVSVGSYLLRGMWS